MAEVDYYAVLGVLPDAEDVVVTAAYRALAQRYHPDRWPGDPAEAHRWMSEINRAYATLGDKAARAEYDRARHASGQQASFDQADNGTQDEAFESALKELETRWQLALTVFPDLADHRARLARISTSLAFAFVSFLLETKGFAKRAQVASHLEAGFLQRFFGTDPKVLEFARELIFAGQKAAAMALNELVDVLGSDVDASLLIQQINVRFDLPAAREARLRREEVQRLIPHVRTGRDYDAAAQLARLLGYQLTEKSAGLFSGLKVTVMAAGGIHEFDEMAFKRWASQHLCGEADKLYAAA